MGPREGPDDDDDDDDDDDNSKSIKGRSWKRLYVLNLAENQHATSERALLSPERKALERSGRSQVSYNTEERRQGVQLLYRRATREIYTCY